ncbi:MAG: hypothetical protein ACE5GM_07425 [bacterium]
MAKKWDKKLFSVVIIVVSFLIPLKAGARFERGKQKYYAVDEVNPYFDKNNVVVVSGMIVNVITVPIPMNEHVIVPGMGLIIQLPDKRNLSVRLGPFWYLFEKQADYKVGEEVQLKGAVMKDQQGNDYMVAARITSGTTSIGLRDDFGVPMWQHFAGNLDMFNQE